MKPQGDIRQTGEPILQRVLWGALIVILIGVLGAGTWSVVRERTTARRLRAGPAARLPVYGSVPDFSLIERSGRRVERGGFLGKIWVVNFIYTHCPDSCPLQSAQMARLQADVANESDVRLVSITVDPKQDTPQVLSRYANRFGADPERWLFLTGEKEAIYRFAREGLHLAVIDPGNEARAPGGAQMPSERGNSQPAPLPGQRVTDRRAGAAFVPGGLRRTLEPAPASAGDETLGARLLHASRFVLVDRRARIRSYYDSTDTESLWRLRQDVKALLREG